MPRLSKTEAMKELGRVYRHRVVIQRRERTETHNGPVYSWRDVSAYWAKIEILGLSGRERYGQIGHSDVRHRIIFHGQPNISLADTRFKYNDKYYRPIEPPATVDGGDRWMSVAVKEVRDDAN